MKFNSFIPYPLNKFFEIEERLQKLEESCEIMAKRVFNFDEPEKKSKWEVGQRVKIISYGDIIEVDADTDSLIINSQNGITIVNPKQCRRLKKK